MSEASAELISINEDLENYFSNTIIPQLFVDADMILRKFTPPAMKQFSLSDADINRHIEDVKDNIRYPTLIENIKEVIDTNEILEKEVQTTDKRWFQMNILPYTVRKENRTNGVIITFVDITKRLAVLKELEKLNAEHDTLVFALSHDIRQPLSRIILLTDQLTDAYNNSNTERFNKWIESLSRASKNMKELLDDFAGHISKKSELINTDERINIENISEDVILALRDDIYNRDVHIQTAFNISEIRFSRKNLRSILYNLLHNAMKYREESRSLNIHVSTRTEPGFIVLAVKDNGAGIKAEHQKIIFDKHSRIHHHIEGTGMGLYIVSKMLEEKGGKIEVCSVAGEGSIFSVYFKE